jgi:hypothetical protein
MATAQEVVEADFLPAEAERQPAVDRPDAATWMSVPLENLRALGSGFP